MLCVDDVILRSWRRWVDALHRRALRVRKGSRGTSVERGISLQVLHVEALC